MMAVRFFRGMNVNDEEQAKTAAELEPTVPGFIRPIGPRGRSPRDLVLVKWTAWIVMAVFLLLAALLLWGLATGEPSPLPDGD